MSLGENPIGNESSNESTNTAAPGGSSKPPTADLDVEEDDLPEEEYEPLSTTVIDDFAANALTGCLSLLDSLPDSVYRVCDLLLAVFNRNGPDFKETILKSLINEVHEAVRKLNE